MSRSPHRGEIVPLGRDRSSSRHDRGPAREPLIAAQQRGTPRSVRDDQANRPPRDWKAAQVEAEQPRGA